MTEKIIEEHFPVEVLKDKIKDLFEVVIHCGTIDQIYSKVKTSAPSKNYLSDYQDFNPKNLQATLQATASKTLKKPHFWAILHAFLDTFGHFFALLDGCDFF